MLSLPSLPRLPLRFPCLPRLPRLRTQPTQFTHVRRYSGCFAKKTVNVPISKSRALSFVLRKHLHGSPEKIYGTTILAVRKDKKLVMIGDGQVTQGSTVLKGDTKKIRVLSDGGVLVGFAGSTADAISLVERLEIRLEEHPGQLMRACVELAKMWRTDKFLRHLDATLITADRDTTLMLTGSGDVVEPSNHVVGIGSGSAYAVAAARALYDIPGLSALEIAQRAMKIAGDMCVYTNHNTIVETLDNSPPPPSPSPSPSPSPLPSPSPSSDAKSSTPA